jgi:hypothetical protein
VGCGRQFESVLKRVGECGQRLALGTPGRTEDEVALLDAWYFRRATSIQITRPPKTQLPQASFTHRDAAAPRPRTGKLGHSST